MHNIIDAFYKELEERGEPDIAIYDSMLYGAMFQTDGSHRPSAEELVEFAKAAEWSKPESAEESKPESPEESKPESPEETETTITIEEEKKDAEVEPKPDEPVAVEIATKETFQELLFKNENFMTCASGFFYENQGEPRTNLDRKK